MIATVNPASGETIRTFEALTESELDDRLQRAFAAFQSYRHTSFRDRAHWMSCAAEILEREKDEFGRLMTLEMGKPLRAAVDGSAQVRAWLPLLRGERREAAGR